MVKPYGGIDTIIGNDSIWIPVYEKSKELPINLAKSTITNNGENFVSLATNVTRYILQSLLSVW